MRDLAFHSKWRVLTGIPAGTRAAHLNPVVAGAVSPSARVHQGAETPIGARSPGGITVRMLVCVRWSWVHSLHDDQEEGPAIGDTTC